MDVPWGSTPARQLRLCNVRPTRDIHAFGSRAKSAQPEKSRSQSYFSSQDRSLVVGTESLQSINGGILA